jgi:RecA-family ATPase
LHVQRVWPLLLELIAPLEPVYVTLDPSVLFGPGERHGNDAAAAFAALMHETAQQLGGCVQTVDHVAQSVARAGIVDQYASRGGTGKVDESRVARQLVRVSEETTEPLPLVVTPRDLAEGRILQLHWTKLSYAPRPPAVWLRRRGYWFETLRAPNAEETIERRSAGTEQRVQRAEAAVLAYVRERTAAGDRLGKRDIERSTIIDLDTGDRLTVREAAEAVRRMLASGNLVRRELPPDQRNGFRQDYIDAP